MPFVVQRGRGPDEDPRADLLVNPLKRVLKGIRPVGQTKWGGRLRLIAKKQFLVGVYRCHGDVGGRPSRNLPFENHARRKCDLFPALSKCAYCKGHFAADPSAGGGRD